jgi:hypothetical protein
MWGEKKIETNKHTLWPPKRHIDRYNIPEKVQRFSAIIARVPTLLSLQEGILNDNLRSVRQNIIRKDIHLYSAV